MPRSIPFDSLHFKTESPPSPKHIFDTVREAVSSTRPDTRAILEELQPCMEGNFRIVDLIGPAAEQHVVHVLRSLEKSGRGINTDHLSKEPVNPQAINIRLGKMNKGIPNVYAASLADGRVLASYDGLVIAGGIPTVIESKMTNDQDLLYEAFKPESIRKKLNPLLAYYGVKPNYWVVIPPEEIASENRVQQAFKSQGGKIIPFCMQLEEWKKEVERAYHSMS